MKFHVLTLFPDMVRNGLQTSIIGRAVENNFIEINAVDIRDFSKDKHGKVDDYTYGGGAGMLMQAQPVYDAWKSVADNYGDRKNPESDERQFVQKKRPRTIYVTPQGHPFTQQYAMELAKEEELVFLCGHYEGIDARVLDEVVTDYISLGDYVLTGGELPAMVMIDAVSRLVPGVLHNEESAQTESFHRNLLEYPQYSRPEVWHDKAVPKVLLSGNHREIEKWRLEQSIALTRERRPDLYAAYQEQEVLIKKLSKKKRANIHMMESIAQGKGEILVNDGDNILIYDRDSRIAMITAKDEQNVEMLIGKIPKETKQIITSHMFLNPILEEQLGFVVEKECKNVCYTERNPLSVRHKITGDMADSATETVLWVNRELEQGCVPYCQVSVEDKGRLEMLEQLKLYISKESVWCLKR